MTMNDLLDRVADSLVAQQTYLFNYGTLARPVFAPPGGTYDPPVAVTLTCPAGAESHFTTDGSGPTSDSPRFSSAIDVTVPTTINAACFQADWTPSPATSAIYQIRTATPTITRTPTSAP